MKLHEELLRPAPFRTLEQEALLNLLRIGDQLDNRLERLFRLHGLTLSRFNLLRILELAERPLTCGEMSARMLQVVPAITSLVDHLEHQGLVVRERSVEDRRVVHVRITDQGKRLAAETMKPVEELEQRLMKEMKRNELKMLVELLDKTRASIAACDAAAACNAGKP
jgi:DNA-binding MarR family transcriptional regulator